MIPNRLMHLGKLNGGESGVDLTLRKPLILVIEDDPDNLVLLYHFLTLNDFDVLLAPDAPTGLKLATNHPPDLILLDMRMPKISGYELVLSIRKTLQLAAIPIIAVTGMSTDQERREILQAGCVDYVCKPYLLDRLLAAIQRQLAELLPRAAMA